MMKLLYPRFAQMRNRLKHRDRRLYLKTLIMGFFCAIFWAAIFIVFYRVLAYFKGIDIVGSFLAAKLLSMALLSFFSILIFSNIITALSVFFMSEELQLVTATPYDADELYLSKLAETVINSSWMVVLFSLPVFLSYGIIFRQGAAYYCMALLTLIPLFVIAGTLGTAVALGLVKSFPARRLKDIFFLLALFLFLGLYSMFRFMKPERLVDPDIFITVIDYLSVLKAPASPFLPSQWVTDVLSVFLFQNQGDDPAFSFACLWSTALAFVVMLGWCFRRIFFGAWSKAQEAKSIRAKRWIFFNRLLNAVLSQLTPPLRAIVDKDIRSFLRDTAQWSQLFILLAIIVIYLYNFSVLPLAKSPIPTRQLQNILAFLNLGLAGFVITAVAVRFAFPAISLEGESFWIIKSSPVGLRGLILCKFWLNCVLLSVLAEVLIICSNILLEIDRFMMFISAGTILLMTFSITSLGIGIGAAFPRFRYENIAQIPTGFGGLVFMMLAMIYCILIVIVEALPLEMYLTAAAAGKSLRPVQWIISAGCLVFNCLLSIAACIIPIKIGLYRLSRIESF
jgi:ABC-2 type transport system permease protein